MELMGVVLPSTNGKRRCWMGLTHSSDRLGRVPKISRWFADGVGSSAGWCGYQTLDVSIGLNSLCLLLGFWYPGYGRFI